MGETAAAQGPGPSAPPEEPKLPPTVVGGVALITAALASVGLSGGTLTRAVRNDPDKMALAIALFVAGVSVMTAIAIIGRLWLAVSTLVIAGGVISLVFIGADAVSEREQPRVALSSTTADGVTTIKVVASGSGLASDEDMLVQLEAMPAYPLNRARSPEPCSGSRLSEGAEPSATRGPLLLWQQAGPDSDGHTEVDSTIQVPAGKYPGVCAFIAFKNQPDQPLGDQRYVKSFLGLDASVGTPPPLPKADVGDEGAGSPSAEELVGAR
jgi:hypothetical protein